MEYNVLTGVLHRHRFDDDPDQDETFHFDAYQFYVLHMFEKQNFLRLLFTAVPVDIALPFSSALQA